MRLISNVPMPGAIDLYRLQRLDRNDILHWFDVIHQDANKVFLEKGYPQHIINTSFAYCDFVWPIKIWCVPMCLAAELKQFASIDPLPLETRHTANFIINKKQINRFLAIKLCEFFDIDTGYTWSGIGRNFDMVNIIEEWNRMNLVLPDSVKNFMLSPITTLPQWVGQYDGVTEVSVEKYGGNLNSWQCGIDKIVSQSAISIITESIRFEKAINFSEKTAYAMLGQTFPIWVGGYKQADEWRDMGFDVFDDIIDHSYQFHDTLFERCWYAFSDNLEVLQNKNFANRLRQSCQSRLRQNFNLFIGNQVQKSMVNRIKSWPNFVQTFVRDIATHVYDINVS